MSIERELLSEFSSQVLVAEMGAVDVLWPYRERLRVSWPSASIAWRPDDSVAYEGRAGDSKKPPPRLARAREGDGVNRPGMSME